MLVAGAILVHALAVACGGGEKGAHAGTGGSGTGSGSGGSGECGCAPKAPQSFLVPCDQVLDPMYPQKLSAVHTFPGRTKEDLAVNLALMEPIDPPYLGYSLTPDRYTAAVFYSDGKVAAGCDPGFTQLLFVLRQ